MRRPTYRRMRLLCRNDLGQGVVVGGHAGVVLVLEADDDGVPDSALRR